MYKNLSLIILVYEVEDHSINLKYYLALSSETYLKQPYPIQDSNIDRYRIENKIKRSKIVFGNDKNHYYSSRHSRTNTQDLADISKELKVAADNVKTKLQSHHFKFGSFKPEYNPTSISGDKQLMTQNTINEVPKISNKIKPKMYSTQNAWNSRKPYASSKERKYELSRSKAESRDDSGERAEATSSN